MPKIVLLFLSLWILYPCHASENAIQISGPTVVFLHQKVDYKINVTVASKDARAILEIPSEMEYISSSPKGIFQKSTDNATKGKVEWELSGNLEISVTLQGVAKGRFKVVAKLLQGTSRQECSKDSMIIGVPALHVHCYDTEDPVEVGKNTVYVFEARNEGQGPITNLAFSSVFASNMRFLEAQGPTEFRQENGNVVFESLPILQPGDRAIYKIHATAIAKGPAIHAGTWRYDQFEGNLLVNESTFVGNKNSPALHFSCYDTEDPVEVGMDTIYVVEIRNEGSAPLSNLHLKYEIPKELSFINASSPTAYKIVGQRIEFQAIPVLKPGQKSSFKIKMQAKQAGSAASVMKLSCTEIQQEIIQTEGTSIFK